jgi:hypothetical protein
VVVLHFLAQDNRQLLSPDFFPDDLCAFQSYSWELPRGQRVKSENMVTSVPQLKRLKDNGTQHLGYIAYSNREARRHCHLLLLHFCDGFL